MAADAVEPRTFLTAPPAPSARGHQAGGLALVASGLLLALLLAAALQRTEPPPAPLIAVGGVGALGLLGLAIVRYEVAVAAGLVLLGIVRVEPGPADAIFAFVIAVGLVRGQLDPRRLPPTMSALLGGLIVLNLLSMTAAIDTGAALTYVVITLYLAVLGLWVATFVDSRRRARMLVIAYVAGAALWAAIGSLALLAPIPGRDVLLLDGCCRAQALFKDPNVYGPFLVPALLLVLEELLTPRLLPGRRTLKLLGLAILTLGVLLSFSRAAWLNLAVAVVVMLAVLMLRRRGAGPAAALLLAVLVVGGATFAGLVAAGETSFLEQRATGQTYDSDRFAAQRTGLTLATEFPLGVGPGQFDRVSPVSAHSIYVRVLAEQGVAGLVILLGLMLGTLALALRHAVRGIATAGIGSAALLAAWCGLLANGAVIDTLHWRHMWLVAGLIWAGSLLSSRSSDGRR